MKFCNVIDGRWGTDDWSDVQALTSWMARRPYVDASRVGILGGSYGGFMTTWALGHTNRYKAGVTQRQAGDWHVMFGSSDFGFYDIYSLKCYPWEDPMAYHRASPNFYVKSIKSPLLIVHSEEDYRCPIAQGDALFTAMKVLDQAPCELVRRRRRRKRLRNIGNDRVGLVGSKLLAWAGERPGQLASQFVRRNVGRRSTAGRIACHRRFPRRG
jgi:dipeptidyl aminopeptidase/acylaminoacyl peptidase